MNVELLEPIIAAAAAASPANPGDYVQDGLLHCGQCGTPKQSRQNIMGHMITVSCLCQCAVQRRDAEEAERRKQEEYEKITRLKSAGISSQTFRDASFDADDGKNPGPMGILRRYVEKWPVMQP